MEKLADLSKFNAIANLLPLPDRRQANIVKLFKDRFTQYTKLLDEFQQAYRKVYITGQRLAKSDNEQVKAGVSKLLGSLGMGSNDQYFDSYDIIQRAKGGNK